MKVKDYIDAITAGFYTMFQPLKKSFALDWEKAVGWRAWPTDSEKMILYRVEMPVNDVNGRPLMKIDAFDLFPGSDSVILMKIGVPCDPPVIFGMLIVEHLSDCWKTKRIIQGEMENVASSLRKYRSEREEAGLPIETVNNLASVARTSQSEKFLEMDEPGSEMLARFMSPVRHQRGSF